MNQHLESASGTTYALPAWLFIRGFQRPRDVRLVRFDRGQAAPRPPVRREARGVLEGTVKSTDGSIGGTIAALDELLAVLADAPCKLRIDGPASRYLLVLPEDIDDTLTTLTHRATLRIPLVAPDPLWHGASKDEAQAATGVLTEYVLQNPGTARTALKVTLTADALTALTNPRVRNLTTNQDLETTGVVDAGASLIADGERRTLVDGAGTNKLAMAGSAYLAYGLELAPGANTIEVTPGGGTVTPRFQWTERYQ